MSDAIKIIFPFLKCDAPGCDYRDEKITNPIEEYLNRPCPKCRASLLTQADLDVIRTLQETTRLINKAIGTVGTTSNEQIKVRCAMDGTGQIKGITVESTK